MLTQKIILLEFLDYKYSDLYILLFELILWGVICSSIISLLNIEIPVGKE